MINFANGKSISRVVISTAFGHCGDGLFPFTLLPSYCGLMDKVRRREVTVLTKSSTANSRRGNFSQWNPLTWKYVQRLGQDGLLNAYGLTNAGVKKNSMGIRNALSWGYNVIPNLFPEFIRGQAISQTVESIKILATVLGDDFWAIELDLSCPNSGEETDKNIKQSLELIQELKSCFLGLIIIAKISIVHPIGFATMLEENGVDVIHAINTIPFNFLYPESISPLASVGGGGVSGQPAYASMLEYNKRVRQEIAIPMIWGCGITDISSAQECFDAGADSISICTVAVRKPKVAGKIVGKFS